MTTRMLGGTGLGVSRLGLGLAALGRPAYINLGHAQDLESQYDVDRMRERAHAVLDAAWEAGVRYFDVARSYGRAEEFLSSWLEARKIQPEEAVVGSKWGYVYTAGWRVDAEHHEAKDLRAANLRRQLDESRALLDAHLDLYQIHSATLESGVLEDREVVAELGHLRRAGLHVGLTLSGPRQAETLRRALDVTHAGEPLFECVQATWNLLEPSAGEALAEAHSRGLGVIVKEALANGRLTERDREAAFRPGLELLRRWSARLGADTDALALAAALARPWADVVLSGAARAEHVRSNARALQVGWTQEAAAELAVLAEPAALYWSTRGRLAWN